MNPQTIKNTPSIAFIHANWHEAIVLNSYHSFVESLAQRGIDKSQIDLYKVPGSLEIPLQAKLLAETGKYDIIVCAGLIVDGGIYRHDFVASTVLNAMMDVQLAANIPVLSVVLTPHHFQEHKPHLDFFSEHFKLKGREAADACLLMLENIDNIKQLT